MKIDFRVRCLKHVLKATYYFCRHTREITFVLDRNWLKVLQSLVGDAAGARQDQVNKATRYWLRSIIIVFSSDQPIGPESSASQDVDMISEADLEACLSDSSADFATES